MPRQYLLPLSTLNRLPLVQDIALQIVHDLGLRTKRAEFVLSLLSFTNSRKIIITPCSYASTRNVSAVTPYIHAPTCKSSNGYSFNIPLLNTKRRLFPPLSTPSISHFLTPSHSPHFSLKLSTSLVLLNRHFLSPGTSSFPLFKFLQLHFLVLCSGFLYIICVYCVLACTLHLLFFQSP